MQGGTRFPQSKMDLAGLLSRVMGLLKRNSEGEAFD